MGAESRIKRAVRLGRRNVKGGKLDPEKGIAPELIATIFGDDRAGGFRYRTARRIVCRVLGVRPDLGNVKVYRIGATKAIRRRHRAEYEAAARAKLLGAAFANSADKEALSRGFGRL